jgi:hypothetical protein
VRANSTKAPSHELGDPAVALGDLGLDEILPKRLHARVGPRLVGRHQAAVADDSGSQESRRACAPSIRSNPKLASE